MKPASPWDTTVSHRSKHAHIKPTETLWIDFDGGNTDIKAMIHERYKEEIYFSHAVRKITEAEWEKYQQAYKHRPADLSGTAIFKSTLFETYVDEQGKTRQREAGHQAYVVGRQATQVGKGARLVGAAKYEVGHYTAMLEATLILLYPNSHPDVRICVAHPPAMTETNMNRMLSCILGKHEVELPDGRKFTYKVREALPIEEPVADLQCFLLTQEGKQFNIPAMELRPGTQILILNIGGGLTAFLPCIVNERGKIEVNVAVDPIKKGIQDVIRSLQTLLKRDFEQLSKLDEIPLEMMHEALMTGCITIKNDPYPCHEQVAQAMQEIAWPVSQEYQNVYASGVNSAAIIAGGGGGGLTFEYMKSNVLDHPYFFMADVMEDMRYTVIHGADRGLTLELAKRG